ncbi:glycosyltransferase [Alicyclobacillus ferrooxydans]|uniref:glycosyltransferase n=1 Tax=Alicyclobacillus ferrooxydans TaxID=471514 RepID=UPI0006D574A4|nr:glycosyltransferase [Alicyclobacillus ferrooxydans]
MSKPATIVLTSAVAWTGTRARPQHLAAGLAKLGWDVLFVDGPVTWIGPLKNPDLRPRLIPAVPVRELDVDGPGRLRVLSPMASLPFGNMFRTINRINQRLLAEQIQRIAAGPYVLLPMLPGSIDLTSHLLPIATLYDCVDLHADFGGLLNRDLVLEMERQLVSQSRVTFATADALKERLEQWHTDVRLVPNAAQIEHFALTPTLMEHEKLASIPQPRVGYVGGIGAWVDQGLIADMAAARPDVHFVMIGPVETDVSRLEKIPNVHFLGLQPYAELPSFLAGFDIALHAFVQNDLTESVNPVKIYEYLAAGKEVIATTSRELRRLSDLLWVISNPAEAISAMNAILDGAHRTVEAARGEFVSQHSWAARVDAINQALRSAVPPAYLPSEFSFSANA